MRDYGTSMKKLKKSTCDLYCQGEDRDEERKLSEKTNKSFKSNVSLK